MLAFTNVRRCFGDVAAVDGVSLALPAGATTVLIGPSGCGKSTLLRLAVGLVTPEAGTVTVFGETLAAGNLLTLRRRMGYVIQGGGLFPHLTAAGNATLLVRHLGWDEARIEDRQAQLAALVQLPRELLQRYPLELSGGERQRVSLLRALMPDPGLLLLDEPLVALDPIIRVDLQAVLKRVFAALGKTVLLVTHDLAEAAYFGSHIVLMRAGRIVQQGAMQDFIRQPAEPFVTQFVNAQRAPLRALVEAGA